MFDPGSAEKKNELRSIIEDATSITAGIRAWMLLSKEGLPISSAVPSGLEEAEMAAMAAAILNVADLAAERMDQGLLEEILMTNETGYMLIRSVGEKAILVFAAAKNVKTGMLVYSAKDASEKINQLL